MRGGGGKYRHHGRGGTILFSPLKDYGRYSPRRYFKDATRMTIERRFIRMISWNYFVQMVFANRHQLYDSPPTDLRGL